MPGLIVQEWLAPRGGSERVVSQMLESFPDAALTVLWNDDPARFPGARESWLARTSIRNSKVLALPLMPATWRFLPADRPFDWMLVSSHLFAHHARVHKQPDLAKLVYAHTPARYIWEPELDTRGSGVLARAGASLLKPVDRKRAQEARAIAANSNFTRDRIERTWNREAEVIYPPVDVDEIRTGGDWASRASALEQNILERLPETFLLGASRFVPYKRLDFVIRTASALKLPVVLAGGGPGKQHLLACAEQSAVPVIFVDSPSNPMLYSLYQRCLAYVFPAVEDFGIMPVEAMAAGAPVVAPSIGGAAEIVALTNGGTTAAPDGTPNEWAEAAETAAGLDRTAVSDGARRFSNSRFRSELENWVRTYS